MITTNQKSTIDTQKTNRKEPKHNTKEKSSSNKESKRRRNLKITRKKVTK